MNRYRKGANLEREAVNQHIKNGAIFAMRGAGSKCKGKLKVDVIALYSGKGGFWGTLVLEQYKKGKQNCTKEKRKFYSLRIPDDLSVKRNFIQVK